jgi:rRNA maturation RNase YbeY
MPSKSKVCFFFEKRGFPLRDRTALKRFIEGIFKSEGKQLYFVNYIFCSDKYLLNINKRYLKHDFYTDIITFDLSESDQVQAEIYISIDRVRENSREHKTTFKSELQRVIFHGALHLCGYRDKKRMEKAEMRGMENLYMELYAELI